MQNELSNSDREQNYQLRQAAALGDAERIKTLLASGANVDSLANSPLRRAVRHCQTEAVAILLESGAKLGLDEPELILSAAGNGDLTTLNLLLARVQKPYDQDMIDAALVAAVRVGEPLTVNALLGAGADPQARNHESLIVGASTGNIEILKLLKSYGADPSARDSQPLFNATFCKAPRAVEYLIAAGADVLAQRGAPLSIAIGNGDAETVEILLQAGMPMTDPSWVTGAGRTDSVETLLVLAEHGSDWTDYADDLVAIAARNGRARLLKYIMDEALILDRQNLSDCLEPAVQVGASAAVILLLAHRADPTTGKSAAFRLAVNSGQLGIAQLLMKAGARIADLPDTALMQVYEGGDLPLALDLLRGGVAVNPTALTPFTATRLFADLPPESLFLDAAGQPHPDPTRRARFSFCRAILQHAEKHDQTDGTALARWFAEVLAASGH